MIASCDAFIHANENEMFGLVVLEAMAAGLPVVGPDKGGVGELLDESIGQLARGVDPRPAWPRPSKPSSPAMWRP